MPLIINADTIEAAVIGGAVLGGGGGGCPDKGRELARAALSRGTPVLTDPADMSPGDIIVTVSSVGAPAAEDAYVSPDHYCRAVTLLQSHTGIPIAGLITNENGGFATVNGWLQSAALGIPIIDCPCNGRAHPTGSMGSLNLHRLPDYVSHQTAVGGNSDTNSYLELSVSSSITKSAALVRQAAVQAGGLVAVARNPITMDHALAHGAPGAISQAIIIGTDMLDASAQGPQAIVTACCRTLSAELLGQGTVTSVKLITAGGFDRGQVIIDTDQGRLRLTVWNEYMSVHSQHTVLYQFPDLITTLDATTGFPVATADIKQGQQVYVIASDRSNLSLSTTMSDTELLTPVTELINSSS